LSPAGRVEPGQTLFLYRTYYIAGKLKRLAMLEIYVRTPVGNVLMLETMTTDTVFDLKCQIQDKIGCPADLLYLVFVGKVLRNDQTLADYNICTASTQGAHQVQIHGASRTFMDLNFD
jgi:hypothetical protein